MPPSRSRQSSCRQNSCIVDGNVHSTSILHRPLKEGIHLSFMPDIGLNDTGIATFLADGPCRLLTTFGISRGNDHRSPFLPETQSDGFADAATAARDNSHFSC